MGKARILAPVTERCVEESVIRQATAFAHAFKAKVTILYVVELPLSLPIDAEVPELVEEGERFLARMKKLGGHRVSLGTDLVQARHAGPAIVEMAQTERYDAVLMVVDPHGIHRVRSSEVFGDTVKYVFTHFPACWVVGS
ncbi:MAG: universal stress protein [Actinomycetota bacterium]